MGQLTERSSRSQWTFAFVVTSVQQANQRRMGISDNRKHGQAPRCSSSSGRLPPSYFTCVSWLADRRIHCLTARNPASRSLHFAHCPLPFSLCIRNFAFLPLDSPSFSDTVPLEPKHRNTETPKHRNTETPDVKTERRVASKRRDRDVAGSVSPSWSVTPWGSACAAAAAIQEGKRGARRGKQHRHRKHE